MTPNFSVIAAKPWHAGQMARTLRHDHERAALALGLSPHRGISERLSSSSWNRAWMVDGKLAALGGVDAPALSHVGMVWLAVSQWAMCHPVALVREAQRQLDEIMLTKRELVTAVLDGDEASHRFAVFLGFTPWPMAAVSRYGRRSILDGIRAGETERVAVGAGSAVVLRYRGRP
jgi:hypothetical protein